MKKIATILTAVLCLASASAFAQKKSDNLTAHLQPYGFFRTYAAFDTRESKAGSEDLFYYMPLDKDNNEEGKDIYSNPAFRFYAITSRLGLNVLGYKFGSMSVSGKMEADFYLMNGSTASFRLRQAYINLLWDDVNCSGNSINLKIGQAWHPEAADLPYCVNLESGTPFNAFNRSPQIMMDAYVGNLVFTAGILYPMQYRPTGPNGASEDYIKYSLVPECYVGVSYVSKKFLARIGTDFISLVPRYKLTEDSANHYAGTKVDDRINMFNPFIYLQYNDGLLKINAKSVFANGGDHLRLMSGYAVYDTSDELDYKYTPLRNTSNFVSVSYGKKWQAMGMVGYIKALGTAHKLAVDSNGYSSADDIYYMANGFKNMNQMFRVTPTLAYNIGKLTFALEYDYTKVEYGDIDRLDDHGLANKNKHWIENHRVLGMAKLTF
jgi:hypothetical protein